MSEAERLRSQQEGEKSAAHPVLEWARCHPGILILSSLAVAALLGAGSRPEPPRRPETEADFVDGETPLFI